MNQRNQGGRNRRNNKGFKSNEKSRKSSFKKEEGKEGESSRREGGYKPYRGGHKMGQRPYKKKYAPKKRKEEAAPKDGKMRLNKYIANAGICSRREADKYIEEGLVEVNGKMITEMGYKVAPTDVVRFDGKVLSAEKKVYILLNKPKGFITTTKDERDRKTVMDLVQKATSSRVFPVGRLDRQTTGVLLFTNDGDMAKKLTHPSHNVRKIYQVTLDRNLHGDDMAKIREGIRMPEGIAKVDEVSFIEGKPRNQIGVQLHIGWNRVVRRIFEKLGYKVEALDRVTFAGLTKKNLKRGTWRILDKQEIDFLKMM